MNRLSWIPCLFVATLAGCAKHEPGRLHGRVVLEGEPVQAVLVLFCSFDRKMNHSIAHEITDEQGCFTVQEEEHALTPGRYQVLIKDRGVFDGTKSFKRAAPCRYGDRKSSPLQVEFTQWGEQLQDLNLTREKNDMNDWMEIFAKMPVARTK